MIRETCVSRAGECIESRARELLPSLFSFNIGLKRVSLKNEMADSSRHILLIPSNNELLSNPKSASPILWAHGDQ